MTDKKKEIAAIAGVLALITAEEAEAPKLPQVRASLLWQAYGRQQTMLYRDLTQRRLIKRHK
ncbi:MAG TPA: hypothetical protein PKV08_02325 [Candidatus Syntrophosphaera thermopropionivorans]|nr:hypothetical protein [Candidatus Syntrophosphaera thermopropionivorans]HOT40031.1 hypothetical protein [Candidatus Syntrophosphaera thermopropionivorans]HQK57435.1 hypothetical protein [Candidatus Syntrophosphaera thermopropionivorans]HRD00624.1 hypothetical protein [Candidatus Syntrophosphaera thermopropionivorans]